MERDYNYGQPKVNRGCSRFYNIYKTIVGSLDMKYYAINPFMVYAFCHRVFNEVGHDNAIISLKSLRMLVCVLHYEDVHPIEHNGDRFISTSDVDTMIDISEIANEEEQTGRIIENDRHYYVPFYEDTPSFVFDNKYDLYTQALQRRKIPLVIKKN